MAGPNQEVLARLREELSIRPEIPPGVLYQMAQHIDPAIGAQSLQQFHIRYLLPVLQEVQARPKRRKRRSDARSRQRQVRRAAAPAEPAPPKPETPRPPQPPQPAVPRQRQARRPRPAAQPEPRRDTYAERARVRAIFLQFAMALARAETPGEIVEAIRQVSGYVEEVLGRES